MASLVHQRPSALGIDEYSTGGTSADRETPFYAINAAYGRRCRSEVPNEMFRLREFSTKVKPRMTQVPVNTHAPATSRTCNPRFRRVSAKFLNRNFSLSPKHVQFLHPPDTKVEGAAHSPPRRFSDRQPLPQASSVVSADADNSPAGADKNQVYCRRTMLTTAVKSPCLLSL